MFLSLLSKELALILLLDAYLLVFLRSPAQMLELALGDQRLHQTAGKEETILVAPSSTIVRRRQLKEALVIVKIIDYRKGRAGTFKAEIEAGPSESLMIGILEMLRGR